MVVVVVVVVVIDSSSTSITVKGLSPGDSMLWFE